MDEKTIDEFIAAPYIFLPGTIMGFPGFAQEADRADVIAYLKQVSKDPGQTFSKLATGITRTGQPVH